MQKELYLITCIVNFLTVLLLSLLIYFKSTSRQLKIKFSIISFALLWWISCLILNILSVTASSALIYAKLLHIAAIMLPILLLDFTYSFLDPDKNKSNIKKWLYFSGCALIFADIFTPYFVSVSFRIPLDFYVSSPQLLYPLHLLLLTICLFLMIIQLFEAYSISSQSKRINIKLFIIGLLTGYTGAATNYLINYNIVIPYYYPIGNLGISLYISIIGFAILKYQFLGINLLIKKTIIYSILITLITTTYIILIFASEKIFSNFIGYKSLPLAIILISMFSVLYTPLKNRIQRFIDNRFFRGSIDQIDEENIKLRDELQKSEKMKAVATLAAGMAHEIKNPLTSIKTFTEYIDKKKDDPDFINKFKEVVGPEVDRINHIVKQLLEFSKPSELELKDTNINQLLNETLDLLNNNLISRNIKVNKHLSTIPTIKADPNQLKQVFLNLLLNAIEAINHNGTITAETKPVQDNTCHLPHDTCNKPVISISIKDTGCGINKADIPKLFDPFYTNKDSGTGLGLSVVHGIIEKHKGKIEVESEIEIGTKFLITL